MGEEEYVKWALSLRASMAGMDEDMFGEWMRSQMESRLPGLLALKEELDRLIPIVQKLEDQQKKGKKHGKK
jgi:hypothetical protein